MSYKERILKIAEDNGIAIETENPCHRCFGTGIYPTDTMGTSGYQLHDCHNCKGTGKEPKQQ